MEYTLTNAEYQGLKSKLARTIKTARYMSQIVDVCDEAFAIFDKKGYPDSWEDWQRAKEDAQVQIARDKDSW